MWHGASIHRLVSYTKKQQTYTTWHQEAASNKHTQSAHLNILWVNILYYIMCHLIVLKDGCSMLCRHTQKVAGSKDIKSVKLVWSLPWSYRVPIYRYFIQWTWALHILLPEEVHTCTRDWTCVTLETCQMHCYSVCMEQWSSLLSCVVLEACTW